MSDTLKLEVNGEPLQMGLGTTVSDIVAAIGCGVRGVAVAVNSELVRRAEWPTAELSEGDRVEIMHAVAGG